MLTGSDIELSVVQNRELRLEALKKWMLKDRRIEALIDLRRREFHDYRSRQVKPVSFFFRFTVKLYQ